MKGAISEVESLIEAHENRGYSHRGYAIYTDPESAKSIYDRLELVQNGGKPTFKGYDVLISRFIESTQILPKDISDMQTGEYIQPDPPEQLLNQLLSPEKAEYTDPIRNIVGRNYKDHVFLKPFCVWQRFDPEQVERYGHPISTHNLDIIHSDNNEFTKTNIDHSERQKFGYEFRSTPGLDMEQESERNVKNELCQSIHRTIKRVNSTPIYALRKRVFKGPYPVLDIEHTEEILFGQKHTTYEGVLMLNVDDTTAKIEGLATG